MPIHLASLLASLFSPASLPPSLLSHLVVLPGSKAWTLYLDILILSSSGGNVSDLSIVAARSALAATRLPLTRSIGFDEAGVQSAGDGAGMTVDEGFSGLVKGGKAGVRAVDFELIDGGEQGVRLPGWEDLPVGITLNLVRSFPSLNPHLCVQLLIPPSAVQINQLPHLDASVLEESATSSQLVASFLPSGAVCGITQLGEGEIEYARVLPLISVRPLSTLPSPSSSTRFSSFSTPLTCYTARLLVGGEQVRTRTHEGVECKAQGRVIGLGHLNSLPRVAIPAPLHLS